MRENIIYLILTTQRHQLIAMSSNPEQIYSATYSNVPVFEFVTKEGPIMRRKSDSWINATHILKIAKFPKAKRTRILEKDVQTGIHEKVQGGYGKYQGTYVPLELGAEIAKSFNVFEILRPIFEFQYIEGQSTTPPPAPKHSHASASNVAKRQYIQQQKQQKLEQGLDDDELFSKRMKPSISESGDGVRKRGRPKRVALTGRGKPDLRQTQTMPINGKGPSMGTFTSKQDLSFSLFSHMTLPPLMRQDTEKDTIQYMANGLNLKNEDLEPDNSDDEDAEARPTTNTNIEESFKARDKTNTYLGFKETDDDELMTGRELFGSRDSFATSRDSFEKIVQMHSRYSKNSNFGNLPKILSLNGSMSAEGYGLPPFHHSSQFSAPVNSSNIRGDPESVNYFNTLLNFFLEDDGQLPSDTNQKEKPDNINLPERILNPPQPLSKININQPVDNDGNTIFHWACSMANTGMIEFLLSIFSNFIDSDVKNYHGETPLMFMTQFNNSYQFNNFPAILDLLFDGVLSVDNYGRTVLHHIAAACKSTKRDNSSKLSNEQEAQKERFAKYYMDLLLSKIIDLPEYQLLQGGHNENVDDKKELISKFINHQDNEGNTAFHIVAYQMSKKCVKTFIKYHKYIDFSLRNLLSYTVEDYLASHNFVLRLDDGENLIATQDGGNRNNLTGLRAENTRSFEAQLHKTQLAVNLQNSTSNTVTQKLAELSYTVDKELSEKDDKLLTIVRFLRLVAFEKFQSQKSILEIFNLGYLVEDIEKDFETSEEDIQNKSDLLVLDGSGDLIIQDEINRLQNDMTFQYYSTIEEHYQAVRGYKIAREKQIRECLLDLESKNDAASYEVQSQPLKLAIELLEGIKKRKELALRLYEEEIKISSAVKSSETHASNGQSTSSEHNALAFTDETNSERKENQEKENTTDTHSKIADFAKNDKLYKYCKLISLSCGMTMVEVENSIDLIEQSLSRGASTA